MANAAGSGSGGALSCVACTSFSSKGTTVQSNTAKSGGGYMLAGVNASSAVVDSTDFISNTAILDSATIPATGLFVPPAMLQGVRLCLVVGTPYADSQSHPTPAGGNGGGLLVMDGSLYVGGCSFYDNQAQSSGGGIEFAPTCTHNVSLLSLLPIMRQFC